jgi:hypothetical protein
MTKKQYIIPETVDLENELRSSLLDDSNTESLVGGDNPDNEW